MYDYIWGPTFQGDYLDVLGQQKIFEEIELATHQQYFEEMTCLNNIEKAS